MRIRVIFLGPDGAGKTSLINHLRSKASVSTSVLYLGIGEEGWFLRPIRKLTGNLSTRSVSVAFWGVFFPLEIISRRLAASFQSKPVLQFVDRVPGFPILRHSALRLLYLFLLPRPDLVVLLVGESGVIASRKPEETDENRVEEDITKWGLVACALRPKFFLRVDTVDNDLEKSTQLVLTKIREIQSCRGK